MRGRGADISVGWKTLGHSGPRVRASRIRALCAKRRAASTCAACARVVEPETGIMQTLNVVQGRSRDIRQRNLVDKNVDAVQFGNNAPVFAYVEAQRILETRAAAANDGNPDTLLPPDSLLPSQFSYCLAPLARHPDT